ncbi:MAG TPA: BrnA antitoxin family protein [Gemmatimonadaceae bacterium]
MRKRSKPSRIARRPVPHFTSEEAESAFWLSHDSTEYADWRKAKSVDLPTLKPGTETISLRIPAGLLEDLKVLANQRDVPYQSLLKVFLADRVEAERRGSRRRAS